MFFSLKLSIICSSMTSVDPFFTSYLQSWAMACDTFLASQQRQRDNVMELQRQEKNKKNVKALVSKNGAATKHIDIISQSTVFRPENMVTLARQFCRMPNSFYLRAWSSSSLTPIPVSSCSTMLQVWLERGWNIRNSSAAVSISGSCQQTPSLTRRKQFLGY